jgi:hypothetical protein
MTQILSGAWQMPARSWRTVTGHVEHIIERDLASLRPQPADLQTSLTAIQITVDSLVKNHPNIELHKVVAEVRAARLKGATYKT